MKRPAFLGLAIVVIVATVLLISSTGGTDPIVPRDALRLTLSTDPANQPVPPGFVGYSFEYRAVEGYAGIDPSAVNPVLVQLMRALAPGQAPVLRIGGDSTDWTWWPVPGMAKPGGVSYTLGPRWLAVTRALAQATGARLILGLNGEADNLAMVSAEARAMFAGIGASRIQALELGNEPELWGIFPWYRLNGHSVPGRTGNYDVASFTHDFALFASALPPFPLAGPTTGALGWMQKLPEFIRGAPRLAVVTVHRYPLNRCFTAPNSNQYPTIPNLLSDAASTGLAASVAPSVAVAHAHGLRLRVDELNSVACSGASTVSDTFASSLWAVDALFEMARVGVDGVNIHTFPLAKYGLFDFSHTHGQWQGYVHPEYYGALMFAQAAPAGSRLVPITGAGGALKAWATRAPDGRIRVALVNLGSSRPRTLAIRVPGASGTAALERLRAPSLTANQGITFGGYSFGAVTTTGVLPHRSVAIDPIGHTYVVTLPAGSAALLTIPR